MKQDQGSARHKRKSCGKLLATTYIQSLSALWLSFGKNWFSINLANSKIGHHNWHLCSNLVWTPPSSQVQQSNLVASLIRLIPFTASPEGGIWSSLFERWNNRRLHPGCRALVNGRPSVASIEGGVGKSTIVRRRSANLRKFLESRGDSLCCYSPPLLESRGWL